MGLTVAGVLVLVVATQLVEVLFTVFAGILLAVFLAGVTQELTENTRLPRPLAVALTLIGLGGVLVGLWALAGPDISEQASALATLLPDAAERLASRIRTTVQRYGWMQRYVDPSQLLPPVSSVLGRVTNVFRDTLNLLVNGFIILFIGIYGGAAPPAYLGRGGQMGPPPPLPRLGGPCAGGSPAG